MVDVAGVPPEFRRSCENWHGVGFGLLGCAHEELPRRVELVGVQGEARGHGYNSNDGGRPLVETKTS